MCLIAYPRLLVAMVVLRGAGPPVHLIGWNVPFKPVDHSPSILVLHARDSEDKSRSDISPGDLNTSRPLFLPQPHQKYPRQRRNQILDSVEVWVRSEF
ncbi:hypothetical protein LXA43DRAFT_1020484 [Ganoderma leucocontextum]|nr:hypothetical protein LXA43DRAFT_1020484 [Ganoderma leucocontextum]